MSNDTVPQPEDLATSKRPDDVHGDRWTVTGVHGRISYRELAGAVQIVGADGDIDHAGGRWPVRCAAAVESGDDQAVFAVLADVYEANYGSRQ